MNLRIQSDPESPWTTVHGTVEGVGGRLRRAAFHVHADDLQDEDSLLALVGSLERALDA